MRTPEIAGDARCLRSGLSAIRQQQDSRDRGGGELQERDEPRAGGKHERFRGIRRVAFATTVRHAKADASDERGGQYRGLQLHGDVRNRARCKRPVTVHVEIQREHPRPQRQEPQLLQYQTQLIVRAPVSLSFVRGDRIVIPPDHRSAISAYPLANF